MTFTIWPFFRVPSFLDFLLASLYTARVLLVTVPLLPVGTRVSGSGSSAEAVPSRRLDSLQKPYFFLYSMQAQPLLLVAFTVTCTPDFRLPRALALVLGFL